MCFIKSYCSGNRILCQDSHSMPSIPYKSVEEKPFTKSMTSLDSCCNFDSPFRFSSSDYSVMSSLLALVTKNSQLLLKLHKVLIEQQRTLNNQAICLTRLFRWLLKRKKRIAKLTQFQQRAGDLPI